MEVKNVSQEIASNVAPLIGREISVDLAAASFNASARDPNLREFSSNTLLNSNSTNSAGQAAALSMGGSPNNSEMAGARPAEQPDAGLGALETPAKPQVRVSAIETESKPALSVAPVSTKTNVALNEVSEKGSDFFREYFPFGKATYDFYFSAGGIIRDHVDLMTHGVGWMSGFGVAGTSLALFGLAPVPFFGGVAAGIGAYQAIQFMGRALTGAIWGKDGLS